MIIYVISFAISCLIICFAEKSKDNALSTTLLWLAIFVTAVVAGLRADTIGTDVRTYVEPMYNLAKQSNSYVEFLNSSFFKEYVNTKISSTEPGYLLFVYIIAKAVGSLAANLFFTQLFINAFILFGIWHFRDKMNVWLGMLVFYTLFYNESLNMIRQWMAMSVLVYSFKYLSEQRWGRYLICILFAASFHSSGMVGLLFLLVYYLLSSVNDDAKILVALPNRKISLKVTITALVTILLAFLFLNPQVISTLLNGVGRSDYVAGYMKNGISFSLIRLLNVLPMVLLFIFRYKTIKEDARYFFAVTVFGSIAVAQFSTVTTFGGRILDFFTMYNVYTMPLLTKNSKALKLLIIAYCIFYWWYYIVFLHYNDTVPYVFG
jgi:hypothetical protein